MDGQGKIRGMDASEFLFCILCLCARGSGEGGTATNSASTFLPFPHCCVTGQGSMPKKCNNSYRIHWRVYVGNFNVLKMSRERVEIGFICIVYSRCRYLKLRIFIIITHYYYYYARKTALNNNAQQICQ